jgi:hypothetical protein
VIVIMIIGVVNVITHLYAASIGYRLVAKKTFH